MIRLKLYLTGRTVGAERARAALRDVEQRLAQSRGAGLSTEIIDVLERPEAAARDQVFATPTLIRLDPGPVVRLFGDLSDAESIISSLNLAAKPVAEIA